MTTYFQPSSIEQRYETLCGIELSNVEELLCLYTWYRVESPKFLVDCQVRLDHLCHPLHQ